MAKKKAGRPSTKTNGRPPKEPSFEEQPLPTMEQARHSKLDKLCVSIGDAREAANNAHTDEAAGRQAALNYMHDHELSVYKHAGIELVRVPGEDKLRVRLSKGDTSLSDGPGEE